MVCKIARLGKSVYIYYYMIIAKLYSGDFAFVWHVVTSNQLHMVNAIV